MSDDDNNEWAARVQGEVRGAEFFFPDDARNPAPGKYAVVGPTSEVAESGIGIEHAAMLFLATFRKNDEARAAANALVVKATSQR